MMNVTGWAGLKERRKAACRFPDTPRFAEGLLVKRMRVRAVDYRTTTRPVIRDPCTSQSYEYVPAVLNVN
jgi:hypothetical protein